MCIIVYAAYIVCITDSVFVASGYSTHAHPHLLIIPTLCVFCVYIILCTVMINADWYVSYCKLLF